MSIEGIKITREDVEKLNKSGNIYSSQENMQNGDSSSVNSMYFGDDGDIYLDEKGRIIEQQADGSEVYMGWTNQKDFASNEPKKLEEPWNNKPLVQGKDDVITVTPVNDKKNYNRNELKTYVSDNKTNINSAYDYQQYMNKKNSSVNANTTTSNENGNNIKITPIKDYDPSNSTITTSSTEPKTLSDGTVVLASDKDGKPVITLDKEAQNSSNSVASTNNNYGKEIYLNKDGKPVITINNVEPIKNNTIKDVDNVVPYKENNNNATKVAQNKPIDNKEYIAMEQTTTNQDVITPITTSDQLNKNKGIFNEENRLRDLELKTTRNGVEVTGENTNNTGILNDTNRLRPLEVSKTIKNGVVIEDNSVPTPQPVQTNSTPNPAPETITPIITSNNIIDENIAMNEPIPQATPASPSMTDGLDIAMQTAFAEGAYHSEDAARKIADVIINRAVNRGLTLEGVVSEKGQFEAWRNGVKNRGNWGWDHYGDGPTKGSIGTERVQQIFMEELNKALTGQPLTYNYNYFHASGDHVTNVYH